MIVGEPVPEEEILLAYAQSEMFSRRWAEGLARHLTEAIAERVRYSPRGEWSDADRSAVLAAVRAFRPPFLDPLLKLDVVWSEASLAAAEVPRLYVVTDVEYRGLAPDGRLATLVREVDKGKDTPDAEFSGAYRHTKSGFQPSRWQGRPCLVANVAQGPYTVFEGLMRLAVVVSRMQVAKPVPDPIPAYLGVASRLAEWGFAPRAAIADPSPDHPAAELSEPTPARQSGAGTETPFAPVKPQPTS